MGFSTWYPEEVLALGYSTLYPFEFGIPQSTWYPKNLTSKHMVPSKTTNHHRKPNPPSKNPWKPPTTLFKAQSLTKSHQSSTKTTIRYQKIITTKITCIIACDTLRLYNLENRYFWSHREYMWITISTNCLVGSNGSHITQSNINDSGR